ncbi:MAG: hypothetical protein ACXVCI_16430 [Bdellovibrionota bacterium]
MRLLLLILFAAAPAFAEDAPDPWSKQWSECATYNMPQYLATRLTLQDLLKQGVKWEKDVTSELGNIDQITNQTCKRWALDPNGDKPLREFIDVYGAASESALSITDRGQNLLARNLSARSLAENQELAAAHLKFEDFPCGRAFAATQKHIQEKLQAVKTGFQSIRDKCPNAAADIIAKAASARASLQSKTPSSAAAGPARNPASSDITGTDKAQRKDKAGPQ